MEGLQSVNLHQLADLLNDDAIHSDDETIYDGDFRDDDFNPHVPKEYKQTRVIAKPWRQESVIRIFRLLDYVRSFDGPLGDSVLAVHDARNRTGMREHLRNIIPKKSNDVLPAGIPAMVIREDILQRLQPEARRRLRLSQALADIPTDFSRFSTMKTKVTAWDMWSQLQAGKPYIYTRVI